MKHKLLTACLLAALLTPALASANPEPTAYDSRSIGMGLTGTTFLDQPAALAMNPANLEGIGKIGFTFNMTNLLVNQTAPVTGPNTSLSSGLGYGPLASGFIAGRIAPRVVFAGGVYIETGYGSSFDGVVCLDGDVVDPNPRPDTSPPYVPDNNPATCTNGEPQNLDVTFFVGEFSAGFSFRAHEKFLLGLALRMPFSKQTADLYQNIGAAIEGSPTRYDRVKNDLGGIGFPSLRFGFTIKPHRKVRISGMYRMYSKIKLTGTSTTTLAEGAAPLELQSEADWFIPHAVQFGISIQANSHMLWALESRLQFHGADKTGNKNQTVISTLGPIQQTTVVGFGWKNVWSLKIGFEYRFTKDVLALRLGFNAAQSATSGAFTQYFTPPPGFSPSANAGLGFYWDDRNDSSIKDKYRLDLATAFAGTFGNIGNEYIGQPVEVPGSGGETELICSDQQVVRTGCPGDYRVKTWWASVSFTLQY